MKRPLRIGITAGDVNGIGLEVTLKALHGVPGPGDQRAIIVGDFNIIRQQCKKLRLPVPSCWDPAESDIPSEPIVIWDPWPGLDLKWAPGRIHVDAARAAVEWIKFGVQANRDGVLDALVTAPISKEGIHRAGYHVPGHTEMLAELTGTKKFAMMLFGGPLRVVLATRHIPISAVPGAITPALIKDTVRITAEGLAWMGLRRRRIAVCGLNPHAGEGGHIGTEDVKIIAPAIRALRKTGLDVHGPLPGDTVFYQAAAGQYDAVIAMYHDQGLAPLKLIAFDSGVNLTLGLPIVRTSPDHGTAYGIAGKNKANPASMATAIEQARLLAGRPNPWRAKKSPRQ
jgi:4-hydroxythreonine-4-phosphate dehydrogenase